MPNISFHDAEEDGIIAEALAGTRYEEAAATCHRKSSETSRKVTLRWNGTTTVWYPTNQRDRDLWIKWGLM